jgi:hypothetical protein
MKKSEGIPLENITGKEEEGLPENQPMSYLEQRRAFIEAGRPLAPKKTYRLNKVSKKTAAKIEAQNASGDSILDRWFEDRRKEMTGKCALCGGKTEKDNDETYRRSIHHLFDKRPTMFPSVATHPDNFLEVCFWGNSCHSNIHNGTISWQLLHDSEEWGSILEKFIKIYPFIRQEERKNIPEIFLAYINK